jgi:peptidoglycan/LPS O-acetylase OafA/YrhL
VWIRRLLGALLAFGALNAFAGGYYGLSGAAGVPREWLAGSPFSDYFVPSLILFVVVGGSLALAAVIVFSGYRLARPIASAAAAVLLVWIVVQVAIIGYVSWMQPATFAAGLLMLLLLSLLPRRVQPKGKGDSAQRRI